MLVYLMYLFKNFFLQKIHTVKIIKIIATMAITVLIPITSG